MDIEKHTNLMKIDMDYRSLNRKIGELESKELNESEKILLEDLIELRNEKLDSVEIDKP